MFARFYTPADLSAEIVRLEGGEAHHLLHVLRMTAGQTVVLFDGRGTVAQAEIVATGKKSAELRIVQTDRGRQDGVLPLELATPVPKGDRFRWLVEKCTELGVRRLRPIVTARSVVVPGSGKLRKMEQTVIAACKQSGRSRLMPIDPPVGIGDLLSREFPDRTVILGRPGGEPIAAALSSITESREFRGGSAPGISGPPLLIIVGPEGGLTDEEIDEAHAAGARDVDLGMNVLRVETAGTVMAAVCGAMLTASSACRSER